MRSIIAFVAVAFIAAIAAEGKLSTASSIHDLRGPGWEEELEYQNKLLQKKLDTIDTFKSMISKAFSPIEGFGTTPTVNGCDHCRGVFQTVIYLLENNATDKDLKLAANLTCELILKEPTAEKCADIIDEVIKTLRDAERYGKSQGFNVTEVVCDDLLNYCDVPCCETPDMPEQMHLALTGDRNAAESTEMRVSWLTQHNYTASSPGMVWFRETTDGSDSSSSSWSTSQALSYTYTVTNFKGFLHTAIMYNLKPGTKYTYMVGKGYGSANAKVSEEIHFKTFPSNIGTPERPLRFANVADMGMGGTHILTINRMIEMVANDQLDMIVHTGDISYADGDGFRWDRFMREMSPAVRSVPYMTGPGNHEGYANFTAFKARFPHPPTRFGGPDDAMYYSFQVGALQFVMLDSETWWDMPRMDPIQVAWANRVMDQANKEGKFIYVGFHRPMYCSGNGHACQTQAAFLRSRLEPSLLKQNVAVIHTGHVHNYERTYPVYNTSVVSTSYQYPDAPVYFVDGAGGCEEGFSYWNSKTKFGVWSAHHLARTSFMVMTFTQESAPTTSAPGDFKLNMTLVSSRYGTSFDSVTLTKKGRKLSE